MTINKVRNTKKTKGVSIDDAVRSESLLISLSLLVWLEEEFIPHYTIPQVLSSDLRYQIEHTQPKEERD